MTPKTSIFSNFKKDSLAGIIVFLIALPLCLGIAQASGAPLFSGIIAGIVGGIVVGSISGSHLSVAGPAAGLTAIVLAAINELQAFDIFLCAVMVAGVVQMILGFLKGGIIGSYFPFAVIEGMLAGIGLTIIIKQIPEAIGYDPQKFMRDAEDGFSWSNFTESFQHIEYGAVIIAAFSLLLLILWTTKPFKKLALIPSGLVVVVLGTLINEMFQWSNSDLFLGAMHLVSLPVAASPLDFIDQFTLPNFSGFLNPAVYKTGVVIAVVASIESLLSVEATDQLDPHKRYTPTNRELKAQGIGNMVSGLIGGLPVTAVIIRSSANVTAGARSKLSAIVHGVLLLVCVATIPFILNKIPKATLAAILLFIGYKLCSPKKAKHLWKKGGMTQFIPYAVTAIAVVSLDLLKGVGIGLLISIFYILRENMKIPYYYHRTRYSEDKDLIKLTLAQEVSFLNKASIKETLNKLPHDSSVIIDAGKTEYIDFDVLEIIKEFQQNKAPDRNINVSLTGFQNVYEVPQAISEEEIVKDFVNIEEPPELSSGTAAKLLKHLNKKKH